MKHWSLLLIISFISLSCAQDGQDQAASKASGTQTEQTTEATPSVNEPYDTPVRGGLAKLVSYQDSVSVLSSKTVLDYYYLLPSQPYFDREAGDDNLASRKKGLTHTNTQNGYLVGGHNFGYPFTMVLYKDKVNKIDYLMAHRIQHPGVMFHSFFEILRFQEGSWSSVFPEISKAGIQYREDHLADFKEDEYVLPVLPEFGTTLKFVKCDLYEDPDCENARVVFSFDWDGQKFVHRTMKD